MAIGPLACLFFAAVAAQPRANFVDVTADAGIRFEHHSGATGKKYLPETLGSGGLFINVDADGWLDILFVNSTDLPSTPAAHTSAALYRNAGNGTFTDITERSGLDVPLYGIGGTAGDYDNDGHTDIYLTALGRNRLLRGRGDGAFADVTAEAGVGDERFSTSALWFDYDNDGALDLFVANYVDWSIDTDLVCTLDGVHKSYCTPESYTGQRPTLYRNRGDGTFDDVTEAAGLDDATLKALGVAMLDYDTDGWMDLFVTNDTEADRLYRNQGDGTFTDIGVVAGVAFSEAGVARAGMGVDAADYDRSGRPSLIIGNFSNEMIALYHNEGNGLFIDEAPRSALGRRSLLTLAFGCFFFDYDLDVLITVNDGPARLLRNDVSDTGNVLRVQLVGTASNRDGIGARVEIALGDGAPLWRLVKTGSSYASQSQLPLTFGLGATAVVESVRVVWPSGRVDTTARVVANQRMTVREGEGVVATAPLGSRR